jgi:myosin V
VERINNSISTSSQDEKLFCGVLDIFGFECFSYNSFEQLCINYTNERLQFFANTFIFKQEQELYKKEGVTWDVSDFPDNQECLDLLEKKNTGIFSLIHDECFIPKGNDRSLLEKFKKQYKDNSRFSMIKTKPEWFLVNHFAGSVPYCIDGFVEKNRDTLSQTLRDLIETSSTPLISSLFK